MRCHFHPIRQAAYRTPKKCAGWWQLSSPTRANRRCSNPGEELLAIGAENFHLEARPRGLCLEAWDRTRNLTRRVTAIKASSPGRLELAVERFAKREGSVYLLDLARRSGADMGRRSGRLVFRERFRLFLRRQFPSWTLAELSAEANLEFSLSPVFPRALLRSGRQGWAAIACPPEADAAALVSFGLIWLFISAVYRAIARISFPLKAESSHPTNAKTIPASNDALSCSIFKILSLSITLLLIKIL